MKLPRVRGTVVLTRIGSVHRGGAKCDSEALSADTCVE